MKKQNKTRLRLFLAIILILIFSAVFLIVLKLRFTRDISPQSKNIISELKKNGKARGIDFQNVSLSPENDIIAYDGNIKIIFSTDKDVASQVTSLQKILKGTKIKKTIESIDLRFNKIVVR